MGGTGLPHLFFAEHCLEMSSDVVERGVQHRRFACISEQLCCVGTVKLVVKCHSDAVALHQLLTSHSAHDGVAGMHRPD